MRAQPAVRTCVGVLAEHQLFDAPNAKLGQQREEPTDGLTQCACYVELLTLLAAVVDSEHSTYLHKMRKGGASWPISVLLAVDGGDHVIQIVQRHILHVRLLAPRLPNHKSSLCAGPTVGRFCGTGRRFCDKTLRSLVTRSEAPPP